MSNFAQTVENNQNLIQSTSGTVASMALTKAGQKVAGILVTPAIWALNYGVKGSTPDKVDVGLYAMGFGGAIASFSAIGVGIMKALVDDDMDTRLREIQRGENSKYAPFIQACYRYASSAPQINAMTIASNGGTAWKHANGLWVYITDIKGRLIKDYQPKTAVTVYRPKDPLTRGSNGKLLWESSRK